jgi:hypothetical protein
MDSNRLPIPLFPNPLAPHPSTRKRRNSDLSYTFSDLDNESDFPPIRVRKSTPDPPQHASEFESSESDFPPIRVRKSTPDLPQPGPASEHSPTWHGFSLSHPRRQSQRPLGHRSRIHEPRQVPEPRVQRYRHGPHPSSSGPGLGHKNLLNTQAVNTKVSSDVLF